MKITHSDKNIYYTSDEGEVISIPISTYTNYSDEYDRYSVLNRIFTELMPYERSQIFSIFKAIIDTWKYLAEDDNEKKLYDKIREYSLILPIERIKEYIIKYIEDGFFKVPKDMELQYKERHGVSSRSKTYILSDFINLASALIHIQPFAPVLLVCVNRIFKAERKDQAWLHVYDSAYIALGWDRLGSIGQLATDKITDYYEEITKNNNTKTLVVIKAMRSPEAITNIAICKLMIRQLQAIDYTSSSVQLIQLLYRQAIAATAAAMSHIKEKRSVTEAGQSDIGLSDLFQITVDPDHAIEQYSESYIQSLRWIPVLANILLDPQEAKVWTIEYGAQEIKNNQILRNRLDLPVSDHITIIINILIRDIILVDSTSLSRDAIIDISLILFLMIRNKYKAIALSLVSRPINKMALPLGGGKIKLEEDDEIGYLKMKDDNHPLKICLTKILDLFYKYTWICYIQEIPSNEMGFKKITDENPSIELINIIKAKRWSILKSKL